METPGRSLPSRSSREAPPPVETWLTLSTVLNFLAQVAVSPPPMMVVTPVSVAATTASIIDLVPFAKFSNSKTPEIKLEKEREMIIYQQGRSTQSFLLRQWQRKRPCWIPVRHLGPSSQLEHLTRRLRFQRLRLQRTKYSIENPAFSPANDAFSRYHFLYRNNNGLKKGLLVSNLKNDDGLKNIKADEQSAQSIFKVWNSIVQ